MAISNKMQSVLFKNGKFIVTPGRLSEPENIVMAATLNKKLEGYGYTLDAKALRTLATQSSAEMTATWNSLLHQIREQTGDRQFRNAELFYPNFPEEVMDNSMAQLYLNSLYYYAYSQLNNDVMQSIAAEIRDSVTQDKTERLPLMETFPTLKVINQGTEQDLFNIMNARIHGLGMSEQQLEELKVFANEYRQDFDVMLGSIEPFQSRENKIKVALMLRDMHRNPEIKLMMKDAVDVLRYTAMLSHENGKYMNNVELREKRGQEIEFKLTTKQKREIQSLLNNCEHLYADIWRQEKLFKRLMNRLSPTEKFGCPARVVGAFDNLAHNRHLDEHGYQLYTFDTERKIAIDEINHGESDTMYALARREPGTFLRNYVSLVAATNPEMRKETIEAVRECSASTSISLKNVLTVRNTVLQRQEQAQKAADEQQVAVYKNKAGKYWVKAREAKDFVLTTEDYKEMVENLNALGADLCKGYQDLGNVYIDPELVNDKVPGTEMRSASGDTTLVQHSTIPCDNEKNLLIVGVNWGAIGDRRTIDVDLSCHAYDKNGAPVAYCSYSNLKDIGMIHSGDYTSVPKDGTSTEAIMLDKQMLRAAGVAYVSFEVHCFSINSFREAKNTRFVMQERDGSLRQNGVGFDGHIPNYYARRTGTENTNIPYGRVQMYTMDADSHLTGEIFEPAASKCNICLDNDASMSCPCICDLDNDRLLWIDAQFDDGQRRGPSVTEDPTNMRGVVLEKYRAENSVVPNMKDLFETYTTHNGTIVDDITKADTVFVHGTVDAEKLGLAENARVVSSFDLDVISKEFAGNNNLAALEQERETAKELRELTQEYRALSEARKPLETQKENPLITQLREYNNQIRNNPYPWRNNNLEDFSRSFE